MSDIDIHNDSFKAIIEELKSRITALEGSSGGAENHLIYPQRWAIGDGTVENPWANDCIQKAYDFAPDGGTVFLRAGYYQLSTSVLYIKKRINIIGEGMGKSFIITDAVNANGIYIEADYVTLKGFTIDGDSQTDDVASLINIHSCDYISLEDIEVKNAGTCGINLYAVNHSSLQNIYAHDNYEHGVHSGTSITGRNRHNTYRNIYSWNNKVSGFDDWGYETDPTEPTYNVYDNLQCLNNGRLGIAICNQTNSNLINSFARGNGREGLYLNDLEDFNIINCLIKSNGITESTSGLVLYSSKNINFTNIIVKNNYNGISLSGNTNDVKFTSCQSYDDREIPLQDWGLCLYDINVELVLLNCKLSPNKNGHTIYNPNGAIITQWPNGADGNLAQLTADFEALLARIKAASEAVNE